MMLENWSGTKIEKKHLNTMIWKWMQVRKQPFYNLDNKKHSCYKNLRLMGQTLQTIAVAASLNAPTYL